MKSLDEIAQALQGFDPQALSVDKAQEFIQHLVQALPAIASEELPLMQALGRIVAEDIISPINVPAHDNSAMDGFAFDGKQLGTAPLQLRVVGTALAGKAWQGNVKSGECVKIMTGAVMPEGLDTVIAQELTTLKAADGETVVEVPAGILQAGDNRRKAGEDLQRGLPALMAGSTLTPAALGLVASLGIAKVKVYRQLRVAYFSTGDEVLSLGDALREGAVYDSNRYTVFGLLSRMGCAVIDMGVVRDDPVFLEDAFKQAASSADVIITSGGVSVGEADFTKAMMKKLGDVAFWKIAMRPGRPMAVGRLGNSILFGLPGNPVAVMVTFLAFVKPALLHLMGGTPSTTPYLRAKSAVALRKKPGRTEYQRGFVRTLPDGTLQVEAAGNQGSGVLRSMVEANGLIVLHHHQSNVAAGDEVDVMMFEGAI
ncbi:MAG: gephyrin-like molybdotransferase Glp [Limnohabitans sp.]|jgi:molybdopterin molybdotransferase